MSQPLRFRMEYGKDDDWYVGRLPGVFSQGATLDEPERNIREAYHMMLEEQSSPDAAKVETRRLKFSPEAPRTHSRVSAAGVYSNPEMNRSAPVPRHSEVPNTTLERTLSERVL